MEKIHTIRKALEEKETRAGSKAQEHLERYQPRYTKTRESKSV